MRRRHLSPPIRPIRPICPIYSFENLYDFSGVVGYYIPGRSSYTKAEEQLHSAWRNTGICPQPGFYEVLNSELMNKLEVKSPPAHHWLLEGHDTYSDIVGLSYQWSIVPW